MSLYAILGFCRIQKINGVTCNKIKNSQGMFHTLFTPSGNLLLVKTMYLCNHL